ncbi:MAG TPA: DUF927 domain-containing protein, partial [Roseiarcus sp.]|nr:DUF927 domain-containing protein [Roseiarcus sp.]
MADERPTKAKTERKPRTERARKGTKPKAANANSNNGRDFTAELKALEALAGGDFTPFIEIAKLDVSFAHEPEALAAINHLAGRARVKVIALLQSETKVRIAPFEAALRAAKGNGADEAGNGGQFLLDQAGLHKLDGKKWDWIAQPFELLGLARDITTDSEIVAGWGKVIRFKNPDGRICEEIVNDAALHGDTNALISQLADHGMRIKGTLAARQSVAEYLVSADAALRVTVVRLIGWIEINGRRAFVLPSEIIGDNLDEQVILMKEAGAPYARRGMLAEWRDAIAAPAVDHLMLRFVISAALTGPLLFPGGFESGLAHLYGPSSVGKTTLLRVAASVWGSGADGGYVRAWRSTANALEGTLASACDTFLPLDELGQADGREIGAVVYMIAGTIGKTRMRRDASLKPPHKWRTFALSSGETPIAVRIGEEQRVKRAHAGQLVRAIDVPVRRELGVFDRPYVDFDAKAFADEMKRGASTCYGTAGPQFVRELIERRIAGDTVRKLVFDFAADALAGIAVDHGQAARVAERFGLIAAAGRLAAEFGLVAWPEDHGQRRPRLCGLLGFSFRGKSDSRLLLGGSLGCDGPVGFERRGVGADGPADHW